MDSSRISGTYGALAANVEKDSSFDIERGEEEATSEQRASCCAKCSLKRVAAYFVSTIAGFGIGAIMVATSKHGSNFKPLEAYLFFGCLLGGMVGFIGPNAYDFIMECKRGEL
jgi:hypothetical protein